MKIVSSADITGENFIGTDLAGYPFNRKYPPDTKRFGTHYGGYRTSQQETFFYDFAVQILRCKIQIQRAELLHC